MRPKTFGRALGIGARVAGKALLDGNAAPTRLPETQAAEQKARIAAAGQRGRAVGSGLGQGTRNLGRGGRNFGRAVWNPFALATSVLWLEITGMFFALFAVFFAQHLYELRGAWRNGDEHSRFLLYAALTALFFYFSASSFVRARRKSKPGA